MLIPVTRAALRNVYAECLGVAWCNVYIFTDHLNSFLPTATQTLACKDVINSIIRMTNYGSRVMNVCTSTTIYIGIFLTLTAQKIQIPFSQ